MSDLVLDCFPLDDHHPRWPRRRWVPYVELSGRRAVRHCLRVGVVVVAGPVAAVVISAAHLARMLREEARW